MQDMDDVAVSTLCISRRLEPNNYVLLLLFLQIFYQWNVH